MSEGRYYRVGQAATELNVSTHHVRQLCDAGLIRAEWTAGQQWRIPTAEVARMNREGVPPIPHQLPEEKASPGRSRTFNAHLLHEPSMDAARVAEETLIKEHRVRQRRLDLEQEEVEDRFRDRERQSLNAKAKVERREWERAWIAIAVKAAPEFELTPAMIHEPIQNLLASLGPEMPQEGVLQLIGSTLQEIQKPLQRAGAVDTAVKVALASLVQFNPSAELMAQAATSVRKAVAAVDQGATDWEITCVAKGAVKPFVEPRRRSRRKAKHHELAFAFAGELSRFSMRGDQGHSSAQTG